MLSVSKLCCSYSGSQILYDIDFKVLPGELVTMIGSNGAGKTTFLKCISGMIKTNNGTTIFEGEEITNSSAAELVKRGIALVPEGRQLFPKLTVEDNLKMGTYTRSVTKEALLKDFDYIYQMFPRVEERKKQLAGTLSGGEQQMVAIGRALLAKPKLLLLDEPSIGLAPQMVEKIFEVIKTLHQQGVTVLLVEQNAGAALSIADRGYILVTGKITIEDKAESLLSHDIVKKSYLGY